MSAQSSSQSPSSRIGAGNFEHMNRELKLVRVGSTKVELPSQIKEDDSQEACAFAFHLICGKLDSNIDLKRKPLACITTLCTSLHISARMISRGLHFVLE